MATTTGAVPIDADPAKAGFLSGYLPQFLDVGRVNGRIYAVPFAFGTPLIYYNKDLLREAGVDPEPTSLQTWDQVIAVAKTVQDKTGVPGLGHLTAGNKDAGTMLMIANAGGDYLSPDGTKLLIDSRQGIAALQLWQDLAVKHKVMPIASDNQALAAFLGGRLGMFMTSSAVLRTAVDATKGKFDLGVANYPVFPGRDARRVTNTGAAFMLYAPEGARREASMKFLNFISRLENSNYWSRESGYMPLEGFAVIREAMRKVGKAGIGKAVLNRRERYLLLEPRGRGILATTLHYPYEVRSEEAAFENVSNAIEPAPENVEAAMALIERLQGKWEPKSFKDRNQEALAELIKAKREGTRAPAAPKAEPPPKVINLFEALRKSIEAEKPAGRAPAKSKGRSASAGPRKAGGGRD